ncbi:hypothetical protein SUGI_0410330 [Cryptomeria japonica]|nr:hypothetical protein SUGI_0410330 [Cryptomeria japonica]
MTMHADYGGQGAHVGGQSASPGVVWWGGLRSHGFQNGVNVAKVDRSGGGVFEVAKQVGLQLPLSSPMQGISQSHPEGEGVQLGSKRVHVMATHSGYDQSNGNATQNQHLAAKAISSASSEYIFPHHQLELGHSIARASYPYTDPFYGGILTYGAQAMIHPHMVGVQQARMPLQLETEEEPVYVNAKQYHGILRRRQSRAKAESENKVVKVRKPYLHESRHLHAMRRARGCGGRFLNTKKLEESKEKTGNAKGTEGVVAHTGSFSRPQPFQNENGNISISQDVQGRTLGMSSSEVMSMAQSHTDGKSYIYTHKHGIYLNEHQDQHLHVSAFQSRTSGSHDSASQDGGALASNGSQQKAVVIR